MEATKNIVSAEGIAMMKDGVRVLNFARGGLVDDEAMVKALQAGKIGSYVTDFPTNALMQFDNVIGVPHLGASTPESEENCAVMAAKEIMDYLENGNITHSVNLPDMQITQETKYRICIINKNIPDMISSVSTALGNHGINIENMASKGKKDLSLIHICN